MYDNFGENHTPLHDCHSKKQLIFAHMLRAHMLLSSTYDLIVCEQGGLRPVLRIDVTQVPKVAQDQIPVRMIGFQTYVYLWTK